MTMYGGALTWLSKKPSSFPGCYHILALDSVCEQHGQGLLARSCDRVTRTTLLDLLVLFAKSKVAKK